MPVVGPVQVGLQAHAARDTYVPLVGLCVVAAWGARELVGRCPALADWPDDPIANNNLGRALTGLGRDAEAAEAYRRAVLSAPGDALYRANLGNVLARLGREAQGEVELRKALRIDPDQARAHDALGRLLAARGRTEGATAHLEAFARLAPDSVAAWNHLAAVRAMAGRLDETAEAVERAAELAQRACDDALAAEQRERARVRGRALTVGGSLRAAGERALTSA